MHAFCGVLLIFVDVLLDRFDDWVVDLRSRPLSPDEVEVVEVGKVHALGDHLRSALISRVTISIRIR